MIQKKHFLLAAATATVIGGTLLSTSQASAAESVADIDPMSSLVEKIATKFNLNKDEVKAVFDESHKEYKAKRQAVNEERLTQLVAEGKITDAQKQLIVAKQAELKASHNTKRESFKNMSAEDRKTAMESERQALHDWATQNKIDLRYVMFGHGRGTGMHGGKVLRTMTPTP